MRHDEAPSPPIDCVERGIDLPGTGGRVAVVADTHSAPHPQTLERLRDEKPHAILHAGDIGDPAVLTRLGEVAPTIAVRGNIDPVGLPDFIHVRLRSGSRALLSVLLTHIAVRGPRVEAPVRRFAEELGASLVVCGHSHVPLINAHDGMAVFNPGSCGPRRFRLPITIGVMEVDGSGLRMRHVDCETGRAWRPLSPTGR